MGANESVISGILVQACAQIQNQNDMEIPENILILIRKIWAHLPDKRRREFELCSCSQPRFMPDPSNLQSEPTQEESISTQEESISTQVPVSRLKRSAPERPQDRRRKRTPGSESKPRATVEYERKLLERAPAWRDKPLSIFGDTLGPQPCCSTVEELIICMVKTQGEGSLNTVRSRLLSVIFHKLKREGLDVQRLRSANAKKITAIAHRSGLSENANSSGYQVTEDQIRGWANLGTKIHELCEAVGGHGTIFFLGPVSDHQLSRRTKKALGDYWDVYVQQIREDIDGPAKEQFDRVSQKVIDQLWGNIQPNLPKKAPSGADIVFQLKYPRGPARQIDKPPMEELMNCILPSSRLRLLRHESEQRISDCPVMRGRSASPPSITPPPDFPRPSRVAYEITGSPSLEEPSSNLNTTSRLLELPVPSTNDQTLGIGAGYSTALSSHDQSGALYPPLPPDYEGFLDLDTGQMNAVLDSVPSLGVDTPQFVEGIQYCNLDFGAMYNMPGPDQPGYPFRTQDDQSSSQDPGYINRFSSSESAESLLSGHDYFSNSLPES